MDTHQEVQYEDQDLALVLEGYPPTWSEKKESYLSATYDASVHYLDRQLDQFIHAFLKQRPNTLIVLTSDHGEGLWDPVHHGRGHGRYLYPSTVRVPHLWIHPSFPKGERISSVTRNIDIVPTLIDLFDISGVEPVAGESFATAFTVPSKSWERNAFVETFFRKEHKKSSSYVSIA